MKLSRFFGILIPASFVLAFSAGAVHAQTAGPEIWFGPASRYSTPDEPRPRAVDLMIQEGYGRTSEARKVIGMIKAAGGEIKYLNIDELLNFGHYFERSATKTGCQLSIKEIISRSAEILNLFKQEFPGIVIGETEPTAMMHEEGNNHIAERHDRTGASGQ
jgi:hypothetical protein